MAEISNDTHHNDKGKEFDLEYEEEEDENSESDKVTGNAVMSIFASYYGIEDDAKKSSLMIDSPQFDANQYVTVNIKKFIEMKSLFVIFM